MTTMTATFPMERMRRFSVVQYHRMIASGALTEDDPVELLEGLLVAKMPRDPAHDGSVLATQNRLLRLLPAEWVLRIQSAVTTRDSEPEPDLAVVSGPETKYFRDHPGRADVELIVEVSNTTLADDQSAKSRIYARERFPVYWIVNLIERRVEVRTDPRGGKSAHYQQVVVYGEDEAVPVVLGGREVGRIAVNEILPPE